MSEPKRGRGRRRPAPPVSVRPGPVSAGGRPDLAKVIGAGAVAVVLAAAANLLLAALARSVLGIPDNFTPLEIGPVSFVTLAAGIAGVGVFVLLVLFTARPLRWFTRVAVATALVSALSPLSLLFGRSRVPSTSGRAVAAAVLLHLVAAAVMIVWLRRRSGVHDLARKQPEPQA